MAQLQIYYATLHPGEAAAELTAQVRQRQVTR